MKQFAVVAGGGELAPRVELAQSYWRRFLGYMGRRRVEPQEGLWLLPCSSVHMFFMRTALDVVYLDREQRVVRLVPEMRPWRVQLLPVAKARSVLELAPGTLRRHPLAVGDQLEFNAGSPSPSGAGPAGALAGLDPSLRSSQ